MIANLFITLSVLWFVASSVKTNKSNSESLSLQFEMQMWVPCLTVVLIGAYGAASMATLELVFK